MTGSAVDVQSMLLPDGTRMQCELTMPQLMFLLGGDSRALAAVRARYPADRTRYPARQLGHLMVEWVDFAGGERIPGIDCVVPDWTTALADRWIALVTALHALDNPATAGIVERLRRAAGLPDVTSPASSAVLARALENDPEFAALAPERAAWRAEVGRARTAFTAACRQAVADAPPLPPPCYRVRYLE